MKEETKKQYSIIGGKNWTVMKRNPGELVMDILYALRSQFTIRYPLFMVFILVMISVSLENKTVEVIWIGREFILRERWNIQWWRRLKLNSFDISRMAIVLLFSRFPMEIVRYTFLANRTYW